MLAFDAVAVRRGTRELFAEFSAQIHGGEKLGVTGANGAGKSSLFALLTGELEPDAGRVDLPAQWRLATVAQELPPSERTAIEIVIDGDRELRDLERRIAHSDGTQQADWLARYEAAGGYQANARAARLLAGLGFAEPQQQTPLVELSGGWRRRVALARCLMARADLLLLDEPTNHLDLDAVIWLEEWLSACPGVVLVISHDRDFLDRCVGRILHIERGRIDSYDGNYSAAERQRAARATQLRSARDRQQREVQRVRAFVDRFRAKASKARQVQSRLKRLERLPELEPAQTPNSFRFEFAAPRKLPHPLLSFRSLRLGYADRVVLDSVDCTLAPGERIGVLGRNGAGKSTLMKALGGELQPMAGERQAADGLAVGYFAQHQLEQLDADSSPLAHLRRLDPTADEQTLRNHLGGFEFSADRVFDSIRPFSMGEQVRLVLALLVYQRPNLLLLDEPANHLDMDMRHALTLALQDFSGALLMVSHDRHLLETCVDRFWLVADAAVTSFDGDLDDYVLWLRRDRQGEAAPEERRSPDRREQRRAEARRRAELRPLREELNRLEAALQGLERERLDVEAELADPALYRSGDGRRIRQLGRRRGALEREIAAVEACWLAASERYESLQN